MFSQLKHESWPAHLAAAVLLFVVAFPSAVFAQRYERVNLVSDIPGVALRSDPNLVNPWGITFAPNGPVWIADNGTGVSTLYTGKGVPFPVGSPLVVTIPPPAGSSGPAAPTGIVFNPTSGFVVSENGKSGASLFIFVTEDGTISGWNLNVDVFNAIKVVDNSSPASNVDGTTLGAVYKGLAIGSRGEKTFIYATNFRDGFVEMYDSNFHFVKKFTDGSLPPGYAPFGIQNIGGNLFVTFSLQNTAKHDDVAGLGHGFVDIFDTDGNLIENFASQGTLNSPWGLALAPPGFGKFSGALLVGDFGDGHINAFESHTGFFLGQLHDQIGQVLTINGLWGLKFADGGLSGKRHHLLFTAGIGDEGHGLFGIIRARGQDEDKDEDDLD